MSLPHVDAPPFEPPYPIGNPRFTTGQAVQVKPGIAPGLAAAILLALDLAIIAGKETACLECRAQGRPAQP